MSKKVAILLAPGFEEVEAITPIDFLRRAGIEVIVTGIGGMEIEGAHGITVKADKTINEVSSDLDGIIIPGGMPGSTNVADSDKAIRIIQEINSAGKLVAAICAAPAVVLTKAGILDGKKVTCYPSFETHFTNSIHVIERVVVDGNIITSQGPGTAAEFSLKIVEILAGKIESDRLFSGTIQK